jgi:hypothetical protein
MNEKNIYIFREEIPQLDSETTYDSGVCLKMLKNSAKLPFCVVC